MKIAGIIDKSVIPLPLEGGNSGRKFKTKKKKN